MLHNLPEHGHFSETKLWAPFLRNDATMLYELAHETFGTYHITSASSNGSTQEFFAILEVALGPFRLGKTAW